MPVPMRAIKKLVGNSISDDFVRKNPYVVTHHLYVVNRVVRNIGVMYDPMLDGLMEDSAGKKPMRSLAFRYNFINAVTNIPKWGYVERTMWDGKYLSILATLRPFVNDYP